MGFNVIKILLVLPIIIVVFLILLDSIKSIATKNKFKEYLLAIGDNETVRRIEMGWWVNLPITIIETIMEKRYEQTKDEIYLLYSDHYRESVTRMRKLCLLLFAALIFYVVLTN